MIPTLRLDGPTWLAADIHLGPSIPRTNAAFLSWLATAPGQVSSVILAGDIFEMWIGDDEAQRHPLPDWLVPIMDTFTTLKTQGVCLYLMTGNRDFLLRKAFADQVGATLLPDDIILESQGQQYYLCHGDALCTDEPGYMRYRRIVHWRWLQWLFLHLPFRWRLAIGNRLRTRSHSRQYGGKDVAKDAVTTLLALYPHIQGLIHGHTHMPAIHSYGQQKRWVLPDWELDHVSTPRQGYGLLNGSFNLMSNIHTD